MKDTSLCLQPVVLTSVLGAASARTACAPSTAAVECTAGAAPADSLPGLATRRALVRLLWSVQDASTERKLHTVSSWRHVGTK